MARVLGLGGLSARLDNIGRDAEDLVFQIVKAAGSEIAVEAAVSITRGSIEGKNHVPSAPGEPPNSKTPNLAIEIIDVADRATLSTQVISRASYSAALEYGTARMAARPFMRPALAAHEPRVRAEMKKAIATVIRRNSKP